MGGRSALGAVMAVWLGLWLGPSLGGAGAALVLALAAPFAWLAWRGPDRVGTVALLIALALAATARGGARHLALERARDALRDREGFHRFAGRVVAPPRRETGEPSVVIEVDAAEPRLIAGSRVRLRLPPGTPVEWSDRLSGVGRLEAPRPIRNPGGYDARAAAEAAGIVAVGRAYTARASPAGGLAAWPRVTCGRWRGAIERCVEQGLSPGARELVAPLLIGDRSAVTPELNARLRAAGLIHLLALSGLHVAWLAAVLRALAAVLGCGPRGRAIAGSACALAYVGIAGPLPSLMRAALTELLRSAARLAGRAIDPVQALAVSALLLLLAYPGWAADLGFQLSCAATLGLVIRIPPLDRAPGRWALAAVTSTAGAQLAALPLLLGRFHAVSWVAPLANLAAVPLAGLLLSAAWLAVGCDALVPGLGHWWFGACEVLAAALRAVSAAAARAPGALLAVGHEAAVPLLAGAGAAVLLAAAAPPRDLEARRRGPSSIRQAAVLAGGLAWALALVLAASARPMLPPAGRTWLVVLDVGQGDALALAFEDAWWLVDAGPRSPRYDAGESVVLPFLRWAAVRRLGALVVTHDDGDHAGGAEAVRRGLGVARVWRPPAFPGVPGPAPRFGGRAAARGALLRQRPRVAALWPPRPGSPLARERVRDDNSASLVLEVGEGAGRLLLLADVDSTVEAELAVAPLVAVLKVSHHGAASSSGARFLARVRPRRAAVSCGRHNAFGHPDQGVLERLAGARAEIGRTDASGALWYEIGRGPPRRLDWRHGPPHAAPRAEPAGGRVAAPRFP